MQFSEAMQSVCRKLNIDYTDLLAGLNGLFVIGDIKEYINNAQRIAWDLHRWDFTEGNKTIVTTVATDYYDYPTDMVSGSGEFLTVAGYKYTKIDFEDYLNWKTDYPTSTDRYWAERGRLIFVNKLAYTAGDEMIVFGKLLMPANLVNDTDLLMFSPDSDNVEHNGNNAICQLAYAEALSSDKKRNPQQGKAERDDAIQKLELIWTPMAADRAKSQNKGRPFFNVPDFFQSNMGSEEIGNF